MSNEERGFLQQLLQMISQTLSADNAVRQQAEAHLEEAKKQSPDNFLLGLTEIVGSSEVPETVSRLPTLPLADLILLGFSFPSGTKEH